MKKLFSLFKASMSEGMNIFKVSTKKNNTFTKVGLPIILALILMRTMFSYSEEMIIELEKSNMEFVLLTLFVIITSIVTIIEGIYKSSSLLFNCKDDNLLLSLPIRKSTVLFIRVFKFYIFELLYNSIFLLPAMVCYAIHTNPNINYYVVSVIGLLLLPIIPILLSCIIGSVISYFSSKFKGKNYAQTIITMIFLLGIMYLSFNTNNLLSDIIFSTFS